MKKQVLTGPTYLTILRMLFAVIFFVFILIPEIWSYTIALILFILASLTDKIDGEWARRKNLVTDLGAFLDPLADKMLTGLAFLALIYLGIIPLWVFAIILVRDYAVDGMRMMSARDGITIPASIFGKLKTTFQMISLACFILNLILKLEPLGIVANIVLYISLALTILSGLDYLIKGFKRITKTKK